MMTHLAGPCMVILERAIQRCAICGFKLADSLGQMAPVGDSEFHAWPEKAFVEVEVGQPTRFSVVGSLTDEKPLPATLCERWQQSRDEVDKL